MVFLELAMVNHLRRGKRWRSGRKSSWGPGGVRAGGQGRGGAGGQEGEEQEVRDKEDAYYHEQGKEGSRVACAVAKSGIS